MRAVLISANPILGRLILPSLRSMGARCHLICGNGAEHLRLSRCCDGVLLAANDLSAVRPERVVEAINRLNRSQAVDCVLASDVDALLLLSRIAKRLDCPTYPMAAGETVKRLNNKWLFHQLCRACDVAVPRTLYYPSKYLIDIRQVQAEIGFPAIVKPLNEWAGVGVAKVDGPDALLGTVVRNDDYEHREVLVQEFVDGDDAGFGGFALNGNLKHWATFFLRKSGTVEFVALPQLVAAAQKMVAVTGFSGVINFDVRIERASGTIRFLECNPRFFIRVRAARLHGLDFVRAGLGPHAPGKRQPQSLTHGTYLPVGNLVSWGGFRHIVSGGWSAGSILRTFRETLSDPRPLFAELDRGGATTGSIDASAAIGPPISTASR